MCRLGATQNAAGLTVVGAPDRDGYRRFDKSEVGSYRSESRPATSECPHGLDAAIDTRAALARRRLFARHANPNASSHRHLSVALPLLAFPIGLHNKPHRSSERR